MATDEEIGELKNGIILSLTLLIALAAGIALWRSRPSIPTQVLPAPGEHSVLVEAEHDLDAP